MRIGLDEAMLGRLYGTVECEAQWVPLLDRMGEVLGVRNAAVQILTARPDRLSQVWLARDSFSHAHAPAHDRWLNAPDNPRFTGERLRYPPPEIGSDSRAFGNAPRLLETVRSGLASIGLGAGFWVGFPLSGNRHFSMILHRGAGDLRDLDEEEEVFLKTLLPHLKQALRLSQRLWDHAEREQWFHTAADRIDVAMLVCDRDMKMLWSNAAVDQLTARSRHVETRGGVLRGKGEVGMKALRALVRDCIDKGTGDGLAVLGQAEDMPLHVKAVPAGAAAPPSAMPSPPDDHAVLFLSEPERPATISAGELVRLFGLTGTEAQLAAALATGESVQDYADRRGVTIGTARIQLKQILAKTGASRQPELVRLICNSIAARTRSSIQ